MYNTNLNRSRLPYENRLPIINRLLLQEPNNTRLMRFLADPPTTTLQRLKGLTTGSLPTFIDVGANFATPEINEDNLIDQVILLSKNTCSISIVLKLLSFYPQAYRLLTVICRSCSWVTVHGPNCFRNDSSENIHCQVSICTIWIPLIQVVQHNYVTHIGTRS